MVTAADDHHSCRRLPNFLFCLFFVLFIPITESVAQRKSDLGFFVGSSYYMGDLNTNLHFIKPGKALGPVFRYNFHPRSSVRVSGIYHSLRADNPEYYFGQGASFASDFIDLAAAFEFNFLPYVTGSKRKNRYSLYTSAGFGYNAPVNASGENPPSGHMTIPFSLGFKFNLGNRLAAGLEWSPRKTFTDTGIDGISNPGEDISEFHLVGNNDWYTFAGVFISYKIFNFRENCPAYDE